MEDHPRWPREAWVPLSTGLLWLALGSRAGFFPFILSIAPGVLLLSSGVAHLLSSGDRQFPHFAALGGGIGALFTFPAFFAFGFGTALFLGLLSAASFVAAGTSALRHEPPADRVPAPEHSLKLSAQVGADEALLAWMKLALRKMTITDAEDVAREVEDARTLFESRGWLEKPADFHETPLPLEVLQIQRASTRVRSGRVVYEHVSFESEYEPRVEEPGRDRWMNRRANRTAHAWVVRHASAERPWLVCIHGYRMGTPLIDLGAFDPGYFHRAMGLNVVLPVLPLHGPRRQGRLSGDDFMEGDVLDTIHAEAQAMWDIRRLLSWMRAQGATKIGVYGLSLGGYTASLLSALEDELDCVIAGIPAVDFARIYWRHGRPEHLRAMEVGGLLPDRVAEVFKVVSPLAMECKVSHEHRAIFGGVADQLVPADQIRDLWEHWDRPSIHWYQGSHVTFMLDKRSHYLVDETLKGAGLFA